MMNLVNNYCERIQYYGKMKPKFKNYFQEDIEEGMSLLHHFGDVAKKYERTALAQDINDRLTEYFTMYYGE